MKVKYLETLGKLVVNRKGILDHWPTDFPSYIVQFGQSLGWSWTPPTHQPTTETFFSLNGVSYGFEIFNEVLIHKKIRFWLKKNSGNPAPPDQQNCPTKKLSDQKNFQLNNFPTNKKILISKKFLTKNNSDQQIFLPKSFSDP